MKRIITILLMITYCFAQSIPEFTLTVDSNEEPYTIHLDVSNIPLDSQLNGIDLSFETTSNVSNVSSNVTGYQLESWSEETFEDYANQTFEFKRASSVDMINKDCCLVEFILALPRLRNKVILSNIVLQYKLDGSDWLLYNDTSFTEYSIEPQPEDSVYSWFLSIDINQNTPGLQYYSTTLYLGMDDNHTSSRDTDEYRLPPRLPGETNGLYCYVQKPQQHPDTRLSEWGDGPIDRDGQYIDDIIEYRELDIGDCEYWYFTVERTSGLGDEFTLDFGFEHPEEYYFTLEQVDQILNGNSFEISEFTPGNYTESYNFSEWGENTNYAYFMVKVCKFMKPCMDFRNGMNFIGVPGGGNSTLYVNDVFLNMTSIPNVFIQQNENFISTNEMTGWKGYWVENLTGDFLWCFDGQSENTSIGSQFKLSTDSGMEIFSFPYLDKRGLVWSINPDDEEIVFYDAQSNITEYGVDADNTIVNKLWRYSADIENTGISGWVEVQYNENSSNNVVYPYFAYFANVVASSSEISISFKAPTKVINSEQFSSKKAYDYESIENWEMFIEGYNSTSCDIISSIGVKADASENYDEEYDYFEPPHAPNDYLMIYFEDNYSGVSGNGKFNNNIKSPIEYNQKAEWDFKVCSSEFNVVLRWRHPGKNIVHLYLIDMGNGSKIDMLEESEYAYTQSTRTDARFKIIAHAPEREIPLNVFPTPFSSELNIEYVVENKTNIDIAVYNILGAKIAQVINEVKCPGSYREVWCPPNEISSGFYFIVRTEGDEVNVRNSVYLSN